MTDVRRSVNELRPDALEQRDLLSAIHKMISQMSATSKVEITLDNSAGRLTLGEDETGSFRKVSPIPSGTERRTR